MKTYYRFHKETAREILQEAILASRDIICKELDFHKSYLWKTSQLTCKEIIDLSFNFITLYSIVWRADEDCWDFGLSCLEETFDLVTHSLSVNVEKSAGDAIIEKFRNVLN